MLSKNKLINLLLKMFPLSKWSTVVCFTHELFLMQVWSKRKRCKNRGSGLYRKGRKKLSGVSNCQVGKFLY